MFQRRHYEAVAKCCASTITPETLDALCEMFQRDNPQFNQQRFRDRVKSLMDNQ